MKNNLVIICLLASFFLPLSLKNKIKTMNREGIMIEGKLYKKYYRTYLC